MKKAITFLALLCVLGVALATPSPQAGKQYYWGQLHYYEVSSNPASQQEFNLIQKGYYGGNWFTDKVAWQDAIKQTVSRMSLNVSGHGQPSQTSTSTKGNGHKPKVTQSPEAIHSDSYETAA